MNRADIRAVLLAAALAAILGGCGGGRIAPVIERAPSPMGSDAATEPAAGRVAAATGETRPETYVVKRGDTLYGIALDHGLEYREIAEWNRLENVNVIRIGQVLRLRPPAEAAVIAAEPVAQARPVQGAGSVEVKPLESKPAAAATLKTEPIARKLPYSEENLALLARPPAKPPAPAAAPASKPEARPAAPSPAPQSDGPADDEKVDWAWPAAGRLIAGFSDPSNKGLDIAGRAGDPVTASAAGRVVYSGSGLRGYGKLIIVKHNNTYLSAYAHNRELLVKEGQSVFKGQRIAELGDTDADRPKLHFEIRRLGKPIDPAKLLPERP